MTVPLEVVPASREHHAAFARFFAELGVEDPLPDPDRWERELAPGTFFLAEAGRLVGYAFLELYGARGYVRHVVVAEDARGRGVGRALMEELARRVRAAGATRWELNVKRDNRPAIALYERYGMRTEHVTHVVRLSLPGVARLAGCARPVLARGVAPAADAEVERAFHLPDGKLARLRSLAGMTLVRLVEHERTVAFARFDPRYPGCFPFHVEAAELARPLLEQLVPLCPRGATWIQLVIEADEATTGALLAAGAQPVFEILHLAGDVPAA
ncbi:MAG: GNAT family N-acetyltransferase [Planctomycetes bacterium]|nr:GNAT family N-acetyltransferase [Planctomycetota bacterium]